MSAAAYYKGELRQDPFSFSVYLQGWKRQNNTGPFSKRGAWTVPNTSDPKLVSCLAKVKSPEGKKESCLNC